QGGEVTGTRADVSVESSNEVRDEIGLGDLVLQEGIECLAGIALLRLDLLLSQLTKSHRGSVACLDVFGAHILGIQLEGCHVDHSGSVHLQEIL
ncbi:hypothetical protein PENTCL1PPCAC_18425, partial [Pristionchus entomophagus]